MPAPAQYRLQSYGRPTAVSSLLQCPINFLSREGRKEGRAEGAILPLSSPPATTLSPLRITTLYVTSSAPRPLVRPSSRLRSSSLKCRKPRFGENSRRVS